MDHWTSQPGRCRPVIIGLVIINELDGNLKSFEFLVLSVQYDDFIEVLFREGQFG